MMNATRKFSKSQLLEFREAFRLFDKDGDGSITKEELGRVMRSLGQFASQDELQQILEEIDIDGDGSFSFDEFVEIVSNMDQFSMTSAEDEEKELREAFKIFDKHGRGFISASDLRAVLHCLGEDLTEEEIEDMIREVDLNGDGRIDFDEFVKALVEPESGSGSEEDEDDDEDDDEQDDDDDDDNDDVPDAILEDENENGDFEIAIHGNRPPLKTTTMTSNNDVIPDEEA